MRCKCGNVATKLCDYYVLVTYGKVKPDSPTCDELLCDECAVVVSSGIMFSHGESGCDAWHSSTDFCKRHDTMHRQTGRVYEYKVPSPINYKHKIITPNP